MNSITIITIVVVALLTLIIFGLSWLAYSSCIKTYKMEVDHGKHDEEIRKEFKTKKKRKGGLLGLIGSWVVLLSLLSLFVVGVAYKANNQNFAINNQISLVVKSGSMSDFYDDKIAEQYNNDKSLQFGVGDICFFDEISSDEPLVEGDVYGYKYKNIIITHRLVSLEEGSLCKFRGDNNPSFDGVVKRENVLYHYTGHKIKTIGVFVGSEVVWYKISKINKDRYELVFKGVKKDEK